MVLDVPISAGFDQALALPQKSFPAMSISLLFYTAKKADQPRSSIHSASKSLVPVAVYCKNKLVAPGTRTKKYLRTQWAVAARAAQSTPAGCLLSWLWLAHDVLFLRYDLASSQVKHVTDVLSTQNRTSTLVKKRSTKHNDKHMTGL